MWFNMLKSNSPRRKLHLPTLKEAIHVEIKNETSFVISEILINNIRRNYKIALLKNNIMTATAIGSHVKYKANREALQGYVGRISRGLGFIKHHTHLGKWVYVRMDSI